MEPRPRGCRTPLTLGDADAVNPDTLLYFLLTHLHTPCYFMVLTGGAVCPTLSSQWSICAHPQAVAVLQVPHCATAAEAHGQWCIVQDMMHEVRAESLDHRTRSAGLEAGEACPRTSHPPQLQVCSSCYGSSAAAPSRLHLPREGYPLKRNPMVEAPCPGPSDAASWGESNAGEPATPCKVSCSGRGAQRFRKASTLDTIPSHPPTRRGGRPQVNTRGMHGALVQCPGRVA